jgi:predicted nucleic acid-binding protein
MLVVSDASPLNYLIRIGHVSVLPTLFTLVLVPTEVADELSRPSTPDVVREFIAAPPPWLSIVAPAGVEAIAGIHRGEQAAIALARERKADTLLVDDRDARHAARSLGVAVVGTLGVLQAAAACGLLDLDAAFASLRATDFRAAPSVYERVLNAHRKRDAGRPGKR